VNESLKLLLADARFPSGDPAHSGGMEAACAAGLVTDLTTLRSFLYGRLWTTGVVGAVAAAAVCSRARTPKTLNTLYATVEAELDARIHSPAAREASRDQGGQILRLAMTITNDPILDCLGRAVVAHRQRPHYPTAVGAVAAVAGASPEEAAEAAAYASVAGPAFAAQTLLGIDAVTVSEVGVEMAPEVARLAGEAAQISMRPLAQMPAFGAPALEYLAEAHLARGVRSFAS
jgi:urease accessory protein